MQESTRLRLEGNWREWKGRIQSKWGDLTDDDFARADGDLETLTGIIKQRTGESLHAVHEKLDDLVHEYMETPSTPKRR